MKNVNRFLVISITAVVKFCVLVFFIHSRVPGNCVTQVPGSMFECVFVDSFLSVIFKSHFNTFLLWL